MKVMFYKDQCAIFKSLVEIIKVLAKTEGVEAVDAICDAYRIADVTGGAEMLRMLRGGTHVKRVTRGRMKTWSKDEMLSYIILLEDMVEGKG